MDTPQITVRVQFTLTPQQLAQLRKELSQYGRPGDTNDLQGSMVLNVANAVYRETRKRRRK